MTFGFRELFGFRRSKSSEAQINRPRIRKKLTWKAQEKEDEEDLRYNNLVAGFCWWSC
jgi:hypothetical protein